MRTPVLAAVLGLGLAAGVAGAQPTPPAVRTQVSDAQVVNVGGYDFDVPASAPALFCVVGRAETLDGVSELSVQAFVRQPDGVRALPAYESVAVGAFSRAAVGDCFALSPVPVTE